MKIFKDSPEFVVPVVRAASQTIERLVQKPVFVFVVSRVANGRTDCHPLVFREGGLTESILSVALLKDPFVANCFRNEKTKGSIFENWSVSC